MLKSLPLSLPALSLFAGCAGSESSQQSIEAAYQEAIMQEQARAAEDEPMAFHGAGPLPPDPIELIDNYQAFMEAEASCAEITEDGNVVTVDFGDLSDACSFRGVDWGGIVTLEVDEADSGLVRLGFDAFSDGIVTIDGTAQVTLGEGTRQVDAELHLSHEAPEGLPEVPEARPEGEPPTGAEGGRPPGPPMGPPPEVDLSETRTLTALDGDFEIGVVIDGVAQANAEDERGNATFTRDGVTIHAGELVPSAGTITMDGPMGEVTMSFERTDSDTVIVTGDGPMGVVSFEVDPSTGAPIE